MKYFILGLIILTFMVANCFADTVTLKNKNSINGIIVEENETSVVLNVGCGTVTLQRADIDSIKRSEQATNILMMKEWRRSYFESFPAPTPHEQKLLDEFKSLREEKEQSTRAIIRKDNIAREISFLQKDVSQLQDELDSIGKKLKSTDPKRDIIKYNALVIEFNSVSNKLRETINMLNELQKDYKGSAAQSVSYINHFLHFKKSFEEEYQQALTSDLSVPQKEFYENLKGRLSMLQKDIRHQEVGFIRQRENVIIPVTLNNKVEALMLVDTGASLTVISREIAKKLGIDPGKIKQDIELVLADGRHLSAKFILLNSVKIGGAETKDVETAIIKGKPSKDVDGLLGMSFLKHFSFIIDPEEQKLLLNYFE